MSVDELERLRDEACGRIDPEKPPAAAQITLETDD